MSASGSGRLATRELPAQPADRPGGAEKVGTAGALGAAGTLLGLTAALLLVAGWHLTQGTSGVGFGELWALATGDRSAATESTRRILVGSRIPRLAAGLAVGFALGVAGALLQSLTRNSLASPDTLAVTAGSYLAVVAVAAFGLTIPLWASGGVAFLGGLTAAVLVLGLSGAGTSTTRILLAGSAVALALQSATATLLILFTQNTTSLFAWGSGSLSQLGLTAFLYAAPVVVVVTVAGLLLSRRLDLLHRHRAGRRAHRSSCHPGRPDRIRRSVRAGHRPAVGASSARAQPSCGADPGLRSGRCAGGDRGGRHDAGHVRCRGGHRHSDRSRHHHRRRCRARAVGS